MAGPELLDRDRELHAVDGLVAEAAEGEARLVLIEGAAGIGKTRLLSEARRRAEAAGMRALTARGSELEREFAFGVVRQHFDRARARERELLLAGAAESAHLALFRDALRPEDSGREYLNFAERSRDASAFFGAGDLARLRAVKAEVDPEGMILANHPV